MFAMLKRMKITKYSHSCLLIETPDRVSIFDPGVYSWLSGTFNIDTLARLDDIIITHDHGDHLNLPFVKSLLLKFPEATITTTEATAEVLRLEGITQAVTEGNDSIELFVADHESMQPLMATMTSNTGVHYLGQLTHPGDSHHFLQTKDILALPIIAPWGSMTAAVQLATSLKPKHIIPIHDAPFNDASRASTYDMLANYFETIGIDFIKPENGVPFEV